jgi:hypothetical protein
MQLVSRGIGGSNCGTFLASQLRTSEAGSRRHLDQMRLPHDNVASKRNSDTTVDGDKNLKKEFMSNFPWNIRPTRRTANDGSDPTTVYFRRAAARPSKTQSNGND